MSDEPLTPAQQAKSARAQEAWVRRAVRMADEHERGLHADGVKRRGCEACHKGKSSPKPESSDESVLTAEAMAEQDALAAALSPDDEEWTGGAGHQYGVASDIEHTVPPSEVDIDSPAGEPPAPVALEFVPDPAGSVIVAGIRGRLVPASEAGPSESPSASGQVADEVPTQEAGAGSTSPAASEPPAPREKTPEEIAAEEAAEAARLEYERVSEEAIQPPEMVPIEAPEAHVIHFVSDGFTGLGKSWYRGQEISLIPGTPEYEQTCDRNGFSWMDLTKVEQIRRYGEVKFEQGPWPYDRTLMTEEEYLAAVGGEDPEEVRRAEKRRQREKMPTAPVARG